MALASVRSRFSFRVWPRLHLVSVHKVLFSLIQFTESELVSVMGVAIIFLAAFVTVLTAISTSTICTNGEMKGGGLYYLVRQFSHILFPRTHNQSSRAHFATHILKMQLNIDLHLPRLRSRELWGLSTAAR